MFEIADMDPRPKIEHIWWSEPIEVFIKEDDGREHAETVKGVYIHHWLESATTAYVDRKNQRPNCQVCIDDTYWVPAILFRCLPTEKE